MTKPIPKSLHTVTVIVRLARFFRGFTVMGDDLNARSIAYAVEKLGYADTPDTHELAAKALEILEKGDK